MGARAAPPISISLRMAVSTRGVGPAGYTQSLFAPFCQRNTRK
jgi:hypothetical protein